MHTLAFSIYKISYHVIENLMGIIGNCVTGEVRRIILAFDVPEHVYILSEMFTMLFCNEKDLRV